MDPTAGPSNRDAATPAPEASERATPSQASGPTADERAATTIESSREQAESSEDRQAARADRDDDRRRRWRRRYRNRYPGPIPTPDEWEPPEGPVRIALQAGHWRANEAPRELSGLKDNGTRWGSMVEWEANLEIVRRTATMLEELGYVVDILPAVVPPSYRAHLFVAIHADGSNDPAARGYRVAAPRRDATGRASAIASLLEHTYQEATGMRRLRSTRRMRNYYAFNFRRYEHALHPMTIAVILETGFLTSARDRSIIVDAPDRAARGIVEAIRRFEVTAQPEATTQAEATAPREVTARPDEATSPDLSGLPDITPPPPPDRPGSPGAQRLIAPPPADPGRPGGRPPGS